MALNLVQHRGEPSVWDRTDDRIPWDSERWLLAVMAGAFLVSGFRRRSVAGLLLVIGGGSLAWWAAAGLDERRVGRGRATGRMRSVLRHHRGGDPVHEAAEESFPASDPPAWTPTLGNAAGPTTDRER